MTDLAVTWAERGGQSWFVAPMPRRKSPNGAGRPTVLALLDERSGAALVKRSSPTVGFQFEFGTLEYRASVYHNAIRGTVPEGVAIIMSDDPAAWHAAAALAKRYPIIGVLHSDDETYYDLLRRYARYLSAVVAVSRRVAARASNVVNESNLLTAVIPCGTLMPQVSSTLGCADEAVMRLLWVGRIEETQKRVTDLPLIAGELRDMGRPFVLDLVGSGPDGARVEEMIRAMGLADMVHMHGWLPRVHVATLMQRADFLLLPSNFEGMSVAAMEALSHGCAVVASRVSGIEDYESSAIARDCLFVHGVGDAAAAARQIIAAWNVPRGRRRAAARNLAETEFSLGVCIGRYETLIERLPKLEGEAPARAMPTWATFASLALASQRAARAWLQRRRLTDVQTHGPG